MKSKILLTVLLLAVSAASFARRAAPGIVAVVRNDFAVTMPGRVTEMKSSRDLTGVKVPGKLITRTYMCNAGRLGNFMVVVQEYPKGTYTGMDTKEILAPMESSSKKSGMETRFIRHRGMVGLEMIMQNPGNPMGSHSRMFVKGDRTYTLTANTNLKNNPYLKRFFSSFKLMK